MATEPQSADSGAAAMDDGTGPILDQFCDNHSCVFPCDGYQLPGNQIRDNEAPARPADHHPFLNGPAFVIAQNSPQGSLYRYQSSTAILVALHRPEIDS